MYSEKVIHGNSIELNAKPNAVSNVHNKVADKLSAIELLFFDQTIFVTG